MAEWSWCRVLDAEEALPLSRKAGAEVHCRRRIRLGEGDAEEFLPVVDVGAAVREGGVAPEHVAAAGGSKRSKRFRLHPLCFPSRLITSARAPNQRQVTW